MSHKRKFTCNYSYFKNIQTEEQAYWWGFIMADGMVGHQVRERKLKTMTTIQERYYFQIALASKDRSHIEKLNKAMESTYNIKEYGSKNPYVRLIIEDRSLCEDLISIGVIPRKSDVVKFPPMKKEHEIPFIRGFFDGNGCISKVTTKYGSFSYECNIVSTKEMLEEIIKRIPSNQNNKLTQRRPENEVNNWTYRFAGNLQVLRVLDYLYGNSKVHLDRKYEKYKELQNYMSRPIQ